MMLLVTVVCAWVGLGALAFGTHRHYARAAGTRLGVRARLALCMAGWLLIALSLCAAYIRDGASFGALLWISLLGVLGVALILLLAYRPRLAYRASGAHALWILTGGRPKS